MNTEVEELRDRMNRATAGIAVPGGLARRAAQHRRRRIVTRATAAAATAVVAAAVAIAATTAAAPHDGGTAAARNGGAPAGARLVSDVRSALAAASARGDMVQLRSLNGAEEQWYYQGHGEVLTRQEAFSPGQPLYDQGSRSTAASYVYTYVSYPAKTWARSVFKTAQQQSPGPRVSCQTPINLSFMQDPAALTTDIREALSCGQLTDKGTADINGVETIKLAGVLDHPVPSGGRVVRITTLYVSPATYLPVRWRVSLTLPQSDGHSATRGVSYDLSWLPPTSANLASLQVPIPAGFTRVFPKPHS